MDPSFEPAEDCKHSEFPCQRQWLWLPSPLRRVLQKPGEIGKQHKLSKLSKTQHGALGRKGKCSFSTTHLHPASEGSGTSISSLRWRRTALERLQTPAQGGASCSCAKFGKRMPRVKVSNSLNLPRAGEDRSCSVHSLLAA